ncbi:MAG TPA: hypothetical protein P5267_01960 [Patescibacteria group bacterium]|nr:hypothetical protein [Patescibacteria group bacterium]
MWLFILDLSVKAPESVTSVAGQMTNTSYVGNILIALIFVVVILLYGFLMDPHNMVINLFALYVGSAVVRFFPFDEWGVLGTALWLGQLILFIAVVVAMAILLSRTHLFRIIYVGNFLARWWSAIINGVLHAGLLVGILLSFLPVKFLTQFSPWALNAFIGIPARFWWTILPLVGLIFMRHKTKAGRPPAY